MAIDYALDCGATICRHNIGRQCVKETRKINADVVILDHTGRCIHLEEREDYHKLFLKTPEEEKPWT
jgi:hypothetical protein